MIDIDDRQINDRHGCGHHFWHNLTIGVRDVPGWGWAAFEKKGVFLTLFHSERNQRSSFLSNAAPFTAWPILMSVGAPKAESLCCIVHLEDELKMSPRSHVFKTISTFSTNCFVLVYLKLGSGMLCRPNLSEANYSTVRTFQPTFQQQNHENPLTAYYHQRQREVCLFVQIRSEW